MSLAIASRPMMVRAIRAAEAGEPLPPDVLYPGIDDGVTGVAFVAAAIASSRANGGWVKLVRR